MIASTEKNSWRQGTATQHQIKFLSQAISFSKDWRLELRATNTLRPAEVKVFVGAGFAIRHTGKQHLLYLTKALGTTQMSPVTAGTEG